MSRYLKIEAGVVVNAIELDSPAKFPQWTLVQSDSADIGDLYDGEAFTKPPSPAPVIPQSVTMRQARLALHAAGLLSGVDAAIAAMTEPDKTAAQITWEFAATVDRGFGMVPQLAAALGMTETQIDDLFIAAAQL